MPYSCEDGCAEILQITNEFCSDERASYLKRHINYLHETISRLRNERRKFMSYKKRGPKPKPIAELVPVNTGFI
jgi:hypothetical protein